jgi:hypothetical protein
VCQASIQVSDAHAVLPPCYPRLKPDQTGTKRWDLDMKRMLLVLIAGLVIGSTATAATGWRVYATATDKGEYSTYASANSKVLKPAALAVRANGPVESVSWNLTCDGETKAAGLSGKVLTVSVATAKSCSVYGSAFGGTGTLRLQLVRAKASGSSRSAVSDRPGTAAAEALGVQLAIRPV